MCQSVIVDFIVEFLYMVSASIADCAMFRTGRGPTFAMEEVSMVWVVNKVSNVAASNLAWQASFV